MMEEMLYRYVYTFSVDKKAKKIELVKAEKGREWNKEDYYWWFSPVGSNSVDEELLMQVKALSEEDGKLVELISVAEKYMKNYLGWNIEEEKK